MCAESLWSIWSVLTSRSVLFLHFEVVIKIFWANRLVWGVTSRLVFCKCPFRIPTGTPVMLTHAFRGFPQSLEENAGIGYDRLLPNHLQFTSYPTIRRYTRVSNLRALLNSLNEFGNSNEYFLITLGYPNVCSIEIISSNVKISLGDKR
jgi:hypothetical protein